MLLFILFFQSKIFSCPIPFILWEPLCTLGKISKKWYVTNVTFLRLPLAYHSLPCSILVRNETNVFNVIKSFCDTNPTFSSAAIRFERTL